jgi:hypothetical protein
METFSFTSGLNPTKIHSDENHDYNPDVDFGGHDLHGFVCSRKTKLQEIAQELPDERQKGMQLRQRLRLLRIRAWLAICNFSARDQLMFSRITLSVTLAVAVLIAPMAPIEIAKAISPHHGCCVKPAVKADPCQHCPMAPTSPASSSGSTCCSVQAPCFVGYAHGLDNFLAGIASGHFAMAVNQRVTARSQRPPVPPPRSAFS